MAKRAIRFTLLACLAMAAPAAAQEPATTIRSVVGIDGTCSRLTTPGEDRSARCEGPALNFNYNNNRASFAFKDGRAALISFSGISQPVSGEEGRLTIDLLTVAALGGEGSTEVRGEAATGLCTFTNPHNGRATIRCRARTASGDYAAEFTSNGAPPDVTTFPERN